MGDNYPPDHGPVDAAQSRLERSVQVSSARDTQFAGFADRLFQELQADLATLFVALGSRKEQDIRTTEGIIQMIIAERAYDLVRHTLSSIAPIDLDRLSLDEQVETIPDMTTWEAQ